MSETRLQRFQARLVEKGLDAAVLAAPETLSPVNVRYLSGFTGSSSYLVIGQHKAFILTDFRYTEQAESQCPGYQVVRHKNPPDESIREILAQQHWTTVGYEPEKITHRMYERWTGAAPDAQWVPLDGLVEELRIVKTPDEIEAIRRAAWIADQALAKVLPTLPGRTERECALDLEVEMLRQGAERVGFATILVSGPRGSLPHGKPSDRRMQRGELVTIDFGAYWQGYHSDETVTVAIGEVEDWHREIFDLVYRAQKTAIDAVRPGGRSRAVDAACRDIIREAGYGEYFGHGAGHGVGLEIHENPFNSSSPNAPDWELKPGMTVTVEPGIYLPGKGGVRLEDTLVVTETGHEYLTTWPKEWQVI
jgi:Xaa-Pro aminopeptidase